jgi:hypothetical protein
MLRRPHLLIFLMGLLAPAHLAQAQPLADPNYLEFTASPDHNAVDSNGQPLLLGYDLLLYIAGSATPVRTVPLGRPTPDQAGTIRLALTSILTPLPAGGTTYEVRVAAVGNTGSSASAPSNSFTFQLPCTYGVSPAARSIGAAAGTTSFAVTAPPGCPWTAAESASWITIASGANGTGNGTVTLTIASNSTTSGRSSALTIAGQTVTVDQTAVACTYTVSPTSRSLGSSGGTSTFSVGAPSGCAWTATETASWITITGGASGSGNGTVAFTVASNSATSARSATMTIGGRGAAVNQAAAPCTYTVSPISQSVVRGGGRVSFTVSSQSGCNWSASEQASWIRIVAGATGSGTGTVTFDVVAHTGSQSRSASATVAGRTVTMSQSAGVAPAAPTGFRVIAQDP